MVDAIDDRDDRPVAGGEERGRIRARDWIALATGLNVAAAVCYLICKAPLRTLSLGVRVRTSIVYLAVACVAGVAGTWVALPRDSRGEFRRLLRCGARGWVFLPAIALFLRWEPVWGMLVAVLSAALMSAYVFRLTGATVKGGVDGSDLKSNGEKMLFSTEVRLTPTTWVPFGLAVCLYGAFAAVAAGMDVFATLLLAITSFLLALEMVAARARMRLIRDKETVQRQHPYALLAAAFGCVLLALSLPGASQSSRFPGLGGPPMNEMAKKPPTPRPPSGYQTIVLWPPKKDEKVIPAPPLKIDSLASGDAKRWVIPFDGPYWYFKFAGETPGPNARTEKGDPLKVNVYSTDRAPLLMEAHQQLSGPIDMTCCREIQVVFRNDTSLGALGVGLSLTDSHSPGRMSQMLGVRFVDANPLEYGPAHAAPVEERLSFMFPAQSRIKKFDEITVTLLPDPRRLTTGRKVEVVRFVIEPN